MERTNGRHLKLTRAMHRVSMHMIADSTARTGRGGEMEKKDKVKKGKKELLVSVKCITSENKKMTTSEVTEPDGGFNDSFLVVVVLISKTREHAVIEVEGHDWSKDRRKKKTVNRKVCPQLSEHIYSIEGLKPILGY